MFIGPKHISHMILKMILQMFYVVCSSLHHSSEWSLPAGKFNELNSMESQWKVLNKLIRIICLDHVICCTSRLIVVVLSLYNRPQKQSYQYYVFIHLYVRENNRKVINNIQRVYKLNIIISLQFPNSQLTI